MTFDLLSSGFWTDDFMGNAIPGLIGFALAQAARWSHKAWIKHRSRGPVWVDLRQGITFVFVSERREEWRAQMTIANHCAELGIEFTRDPYYADKTLDTILKTNLVVIYTGPTAVAAGVQESVALGVLRDWLRGWHGLPDLDQELPDLDQDADESKSGYLIRLPNPHQPNRCIVILVGPHPQSAWAAAMWLCSPRFKEDQHAASGNPFVHRVPFGLTQDVPYLDDSQSVVGAYLTRRRQDAPA